MKILMISHEYPPIGGGGANACMFLSKEFLKKGHEVVLVTAMYSGLKEYEETPEGLRLYRVNSKRKHKEHCSFTEMADFVAKAIPLASKLEKKEHFDICQIYFGIPSGPVGLYLKLKYGLPYIIRFGGGDIPGFQDRFKTLYKLIGPAVKLLWRGSSALVANSSGLRDFALNFYGKCPVEVIPNGVDADTFKPDRERDYAGESIKLLFISRLIERKGLQFLIPHLKDIEKETGRKISFTIVGDGPYRETLEQLARDKDAADMVSFLGQKDKPLLPDLYNAGDIFVFPSKREGMPNAVLEAMASALPVVMSPCEGSDELIDGNGAIAEGEFYKTVIEVINSGKLDAMGRESRKRAEEIFSWAGVAGKYIELMERCRK